MSVPKNHKEVQYMKKLIPILIILLILPLRVHAERLRGVWVSTVANLDYPSRPTTDPEALRAEAVEILDNCAELGINAVFLQVRPAGDALYPSKLYPYSAYLTGTQGLAPDNDFDPLAFWVENAHSRGMELHAWVNPYRVATSASAALADNSPAKLHPEWTVKYNDTLCLDPGIPEARQLVIDGVKEIAENYEVDGIHFDDYFYPGKDFPDEKTYEEYGNGLSRDDWRRANTEELIRDCGEAVHSVNKDLRFGVSPCGIWANRSQNENGSDTSGASAYYDMYADTLKWARDDLIDYIAPQIYWYNGFDAADYSVLSSWWSEQLSDCDTELYIGLGDYRIDQYGNDSSSPWFEGNEIEKQMIMNRENSDIQGEIHFRYGSIVKNASLYEKLRSVYAGEAAKNADMAEECVYIYYNRFGDPIFVKKDLGAFSVAACRSFAPDGAEYGIGVFFDSNGRVKRERVRLAR
jgi:uncharacterized lipoprotein YddW (UPF0748 family)